MTINDQLRALPSVDALLTHADDLIALYGRDAVREALRDTLDSVRQMIRDNDIGTIHTDDILTQTADTLIDHFAPSLQPVINATGVIIHTNLGRAPLSDAAQQAMIAVSHGYSTLEFDLGTGKRGSRHVHAQDLIVEITGAEAALVVNNNAAGTVLMLSALAAGHEVIVSRGQLVEIGGGFRVPAIMSQSGANLVEVGTTNRTRIADYEAAITEDTALLMRVHSSNFKQIGFTEETPLHEMVELAHQHNRLCVDDLGSGALIDTAAYGLEHEPTVQESLAAGCDIVAFSGDKLLGGPQAGILVGKADLIAKLKRHPLARAFRTDKLCLSALAATLDHYRRGDALSAIPVLRMITRPLDELRHEAQTWADTLGECATVIDGESTVGGGSLPGATVPTALLALQVESPDAAMATLRANNIPIIARIQDDQIIFDPRTVLPDQSKTLLNALKVL